jgi:hypothetical protein
MYANAPSIRVSSRFITVTVVVALLISSAFWLLDVYLFIRYAFAAIIPKPVIPNAIHTLFPTDDPTVAIYPIGGIYGRGDLAFLERRNRRNTSGITLLGEGVALNPCVVMRTYKANKRTIPP